VRRLRIFGLIAALHLLMLFGGLIVLTQGSAIGPGRDDLWYGWDKAKTIVPRN